MSNRQNRSVRSGGKRRLIVQFKRATSMPHGSQLLRKRIKRNAMLRKLYSRESRHLLKLIPAYKTGIETQDRVTGRKSMLFRKNLYRASQLEKAHKKLIERAEALPN